MNALIRFLYALLVAGCIVAFAGITIYSFYQPPEYPEYSDSLSETEYDKQADDHNKQEKSYYRNETYILIPIAVVTATAGLYLITRSEVLGEGLALGGVGTSVYGIITASLADARILRFISVTILLVTVLCVAHFRFSPALVRSKLAQHPTD